MIKTETNLKPRILCLAASALLLVGGTAASSAAPAPTSLPAAPAAGSGTETSTAEAPESAWGGTLEQALSQTSGAAQASQMPGGPEETPAQDQDEPQSPEDIQETEPFAPEVQNLSGSGWHSGARGDSIQTAPAAETLPDVSPDQGETDHLENSPGSLSGQAPADEAAPETRSGPEAETGEAGGNVAQAETEAESSLEAAPETVPQAEESSAYGIQAQTDQEPYPEAETGERDQTAAGETGETSWGTGAAGLLPDGSLGQVSIPRVGLSAPIHAGTTTEALVQGAGLWEESSLNSRNVCLFGHNRGNNPWFYGLKDTAVGDEIRLETAAGTRTFRVETAQYISSRDFSWLTQTEAGTETGKSGEAQEETVLTLISCVADRPGLRWMVRGVETETPAEASGRTGAK